MNCDQGNDFNPAEEDVKTQLIQAKHDLVDTRAEYPRRAAQYLGNIVKYEFKIATSIKPDIQDHTQISRLTPEEIEDFQLRTAITLPKVDESIKDRVKNLSGALAIIKAEKEKSNGSRN